MIGLSLRLLIIIRWLGIRRHSHRGTGTEAQSALRNTEKTPWTSVPLWLGIRRHSHRGAVTEAQSALRNTEKNSVDLYDLCASVANVPL